MEVVIENTKADYFYHFNISYLKRIKKLAILLPLFIICFYNMIAASIEKYGSSPWLVIIREVSELIALMLAIYFIQFLIFKIRLDKSIKKNPALLEKVTITLTGTGIKFESNSIKTEWNKIGLVTKDRRFICIKSADAKKTVLIPLRFFDSDYELRLFYNRISH